MPIFNQTEVDELLREERERANKAAIATGCIVMTPPISDGSAGITKLDELEVIVHGAPAGNSHRTFSSESRRYCSGCPFPDGCMMCTLP